MSSPSITVLMPVYNAARFLPEAIDSILSQSFRDFEFLIINDGSTDDSRSILEACSDPRLRIVNTPNRGVSSSLRLGMRLARAPYIARMDADDVAMPDRLSVQKAVLDAHPEVVVTHSRVDRIDDAGRVVETEYGDLRNDVETKWALLWHNAIFHPTVMLRANVLRQARLNYKRETVIAQDYELWSRVAMVGKFYMIADVLLRYRLHDDKISRPGNAAHQHEVISRIIRNNLASYGVDINEEMAQEIAVASGSTHYDMYGWPYNNIPDRLPTLISHIEPRFVKYHGVPPRDIHHEQSRLFAQWARSLGPNFSQAALGFLARALWRRPGLLMQRRCWAILASVTLPPGWIKRFERGERGLPAPRCSGQAKP